MAVIWKDLAKHFHAPSALKISIAKQNERRVQVLLVKNEKEHAWAINSRNID